MLVQQTLDKLEAMGLSGMAQAMRQQLEQSQYLELSFEERLGLLVDREAETREDRRLQLRLKAAKLRQSVSVEEIDFRAPRGLDRSLVLSLAQATWVEAHHNLLITGPTGCGKSFVACALAQAAIRRGHTALYVRAPRLLADLQLARGDGRYPRLLAQLAKVQLLVRDDFLITPAQATKPGISSRSSTTAARSAPPWSSASSRWSAGTRPWPTSPWPTRSWTGSSTTPTASRSRASPCVAASPRSTTHLLRNPVHPPMPRRPRTRHLDPAPWIVCPVCGFHTWTQAAVGRPRLTCSDECRQEAYRRRCRARQVQRDADPNAVTDDPEPGSPAGAGARAPPAAHGLWKVPARGQPGQIAATLRLGHCQVKGDPPSLTTGLGQPPRGVAHTSHSPGDGLRERGPEPARAMVPTTTE
jgi:hypothetical protein